MLVLGSDLIGLTVAHLGSEIPRLQSAASASLRHQLLELPPADNKVVRRV